MKKGYVMKKRLLGLLVVLVWTMTATATMAYDWSQLRGEVDIRLQHKDARGETDGTGGATRQFYEQKAELKIMPFEESEFYVGFEGTFRDYTDSADKKADERKSYNFFVGNTYYTRIFGKTLTSRPEFGYENSNRKSSEAREDRSHESLYFHPKFNLALSRNWALFTRGKLEYKKLDENRDGSTNKTWAPDTRIEGGAKYRWNRTHSTSASIFYRKNSEDTSYYNYQTTMYQARFKHHYNITRSFTVIPYVFLDLNNSRQNNQDDMSKDKYGTKFKWKATPDLELYGGAAYETRKESSSRAGGWNPAYTKRYFVTHAGMKYKF